MRFMCHVLIIAWVVALTSVCAVEPPTSSRPDISPLVQGAALSVDVSSTHRISLRGAANSQAGALTRHDISITSNNEDRGLMSSLIRPFKDAKFYTANYVTNYVWNIRFTVWIRKKMTPEKLYYKLNIAKTSGPRDRKYRKFLEYVEIYEDRFGPAFNPLFKYGPKVEVKASP